MRITRKNSYLKNTVFVVAATLALSGQAPLLAQTTPDTKTQKPPELKLSGKTAPAAVKAPALKKDDFAPETLLVMPNSGSDKNEIADILKELHGNVVRTFGDGPMQTLVIECEKGKLEEVEKKLSKDPHFSVIQRNPKGEAMVAAVTANDPGFPGEWHLSALNVPNAWNSSTGRGVIIGVCDTGCQGNNYDLAGKTYTGMDYFTVRSGKAGGNVDAQANGSHGTLVATSAAALTNNRALTAAPANGAYIYPIRISGPNSSGGFSTSDDIMCNALWECGRNGIRVCNISYGASNAYYSFANKSFRPVFHAWAKWYHDTCNGLLFVSAGNENQYDPNDLCPYMIMVSSLAPNYYRSSFSNYGRPIWFTAPGSSIGCSDRNGKLSWVNGTSFASPLAASVAAMVLARKPGMSNRQVEQTLINSCANVPGSKWNMEFGYGLLNAGLAIANSSKAIGEDDELGADAKLPTPEGPTFVIEKQEEIKVDEKEQTPPPPKEVSDQPTFPLSKTSTAE